MHACRSTLEDPTFDAYVAGDASALTSQEIDGLKLFVGKGRCVDCHGGPNFTDDDFHNVGGRGSTSDTGRFRDIPPLLASPLNSAGPYSDDRHTGRLAGLVSPPPASTYGQFRTPSLRHVAMTAPYMHDGAQPTLESVVALFDAGGYPPTLGNKDPLLRPLGLTWSEQAALVAFMKTLTMSPQAPTRRP